MLTPPLAVYDANVLYSSQLRDITVRLAEAGIVRPRWTERIQDEWMRGLLRKRPELSRERLERTRRLMDAALPDARVTGYERWIDTLSLPDPDDRHVLAAAIRCGADVIVTFDRKHFPRRVLARYGIGVLHPDPFTVGLLAASPDQVHAAVREHRRSLGRPPLSPEEYLASLASAGLPRTAARLRAECSDL